MKRFIFLFIFLFACDAKDNLIIKGNIYGLKKSKLYLYDIEKNTFVDSTFVKNEAFELKSNIDEPFELKIILDSKNSENSYTFFTEPTEVLFSSSKDKFEFNGKIENSVLAKEQEMINVQLRKFEEIKLNLLSQQIKFSADNEKAKYDSINKEREKIEIKKTLFIVNYCLNHPEKYTSAFIAYKYRGIINKQYLRKIYNNFSEKIKSSYYSKKLESNF